MKADLKQCLMRYAIAKKRNGGFTLIELLVTVIIVGILTAVGLPNLLGQIQKAREVEAKNFLGAVGFAQQGFHFENGTFATNLNDLSVTAGTEYYQVAITEANQNAATVIATPDPSSPQIDGLRSYGLGAYFQNGTYDVITCQASSAATVVGVGNMPPGNCIDGRQLL